MMGFEYTPLNIIGLIFCFVMIFCMGLKIEADETTRRFARIIYRVSLAVTWAIIIIR